jgi:hypothetical protein
MNRFLSAHANPVNWQAQGLGSQPLNVTNHNLKISGAIFDVSNSGSNGRTARIGGKKDSAITVEADYDQDLSPYAAPDIEPTQLGVLLVFITPSRAVQCPTIIETVSYQTGGQNTQVKYSFDLKESVLAGNFVYPPQ